MNDRTVYNVVASLNDIGGFYPAVVILGYLVNMIFQNSFFYAALISKLYQMEYLVDNEKLEHSFSRRPSIDSNVSISKRFRDDTSSHGGIKIFDLKGRDTKNRVKEVTDQIKIELNKN